MPTAHIALLTDFGSQDTYVGVVKGVIARLAPEAGLIDITHEVPPGDIRRGAFYLWQSVPYFPEGTIFLAVIDPGVGTHRRSLAAAWPRFSCLAPDNGLLTYLLAQQPPSAVHALTSPERRLPTVSATFHGRDVFAPAAAHLARGEAIQRLGPPVTDPVRFPLPLLEALEGPELRGEVLHADRFGNWITSLGCLRQEAADLVFEPWLPGCASMRLPRTGLALRLPDGSLLPLRTTFEEAAAGAPLAYIGSSGLIEIAVNRGRASDLLPHLTGQPVHLVPTQG
ncbi:MAG: SAM-dependent chlorinase/fluorinase [Chloroflexota bacterium]